ncbi:hypothetical protein V6N12_067096 [Hibiscus sabdariffa]|uniref:Non-specific serine/threonine protein kinase n=1 Tax=Hibiscus sabdariffa TaxID=183260 RepID=A0ABR1ZFR4_9ROSI
MKSTSCWSVLNILPAILILFSSPPFCFARDNITVKSRLADGETLVSAANRFELGFFGPSTTSSVKRYVGIWYTSNPQIRVWVANREKPVSNTTGVLSFADGTLKLTDDKGNLYWSALPGAERSIPVAKLSDDGNFILRDERSRQKLWQSFDYPTDTFLFGMKMDADFLLISWSSEEDPSPGNFTFKQDPEGQLVVMEKSTIHWRSSRLDSNQISKSDELPSTVVKFLNFNQSETRFYQDKRMVMSSTGQLQYWELDEDMKSWSLIWWKPNNNCSVYNFCGDFGTCNANSWLPCKCLPGFKPKFLEKWNAGDFSDGCSRNSSSSCGNDVVSLKRMKVEDSDSSYDAKDETDCREECLEKCQCQAYSFVGQRVSTTSCLIWSDDLKNLQEDQDGGYDLHVRVALSDIEATTRNCETCGTNLVPYPLSTGTKCGDPMYFSFFCDDNTHELSFMAPNGSYGVITVNPDARTFFIQMKAKEAYNCSAMQSSASRILQFNQSSPFNVTGNCRGDVGNLTSDSSLEGTVEVEISWKPPLEPICTSSADCKDWPHSTCNETGNGPRRCICDTAFHWDGSVLNCTQTGQLGGSSDKSKPLSLILGISLPIGTTILCAVVLIYMWRTKVVKRRGKQRKAALHRYDTERGVQELMDLSHFEGKDGTGIDVPFFDFESVLAATNNFSEENKLGKGGFGPVYMGKFPGGEEVAVKRLSSVSGQGLEEFKNETLCYLVNHQANYWTGKHASTSFWELLEDCFIFTKIPARMIQGKQTEANTVRVIGTYGYMAPEYAVDGLFSVKSDVFSFGIVMLEIISGKRNTRFYQVEQDGPNLVSYGWRLWQEDKALDLMDERVRWSCNASEFMRCVHVGMLCVQEDPSERPTMADVVLMLSTQNLSLPNPKQPAYLTRKPLSATTSTFSNAQSNTEITSSIKEGR